MKHYSVLLNESIEALDIKPEGIYVDGTLGRAGHSTKILEKLTTGTLIAFDKDTDALEESKKLLGVKPILIHDSFATIGEHLDELGIDKVDGFLFDLGVSSPQFDDADRGFSYRFDAKLDMRMDQTQTLSAYEVVNEYNEDKLVDILKTYADERYAKGIVKAILKHRPIETTFELVSCVKEAYPSSQLKKGHPAKKTFQAIRMEVNNELKDIENALQDAIKYTKVGGRIAVITFHSIEDRLVKQRFNEVATPPKVNPRIPQIEVSQPKFKWISKQIKPSLKELDENNRSHSAILRVIERTEYDG
ncbi:ribosomal RNA small subunit methyltransferase H [Erysipelothrix larvae]|uniref:Ribosomal RNA small subunit methyltransferase H n=1 Tax=Erysipelothrix larvae TaxID=1514105 RepID=A0A0X8GZ98_9FIRM|nr:16S rRNA (cytosine(1402)-N(4))-methyltransferase RsmH [Erysipelothrix larvae]AMC93173.1 ribosomal RNA small subunit methyltransferase H [Erysipelothrix larvae]